MTGTGTLIEWNDARGFGFIAPDTGGPPLFVHISAFNGGGRPVLGDAVQFSPGPGRDGKPAAIRAKILGVVRVKSRTAPYFDRHAIRVWMAVALIVLIFAAVIFERAPLLILGLYALMGGVTYGVYHLDKARAQSGDRRVSEPALHGLDAGFGILGGLLAQQILRHKTSKPAFALTTYGIAVLHAGVLIGIMTGILN